MKILLLHNFYQLPGGEDLDFELEGKSLEERGHTVIRYSMHNDEVVNYSNIGLGIATLWNRATYRELRALAKKEKPDIAHFHNTFPLISPSAYYAMKSEGIATVQFLHNYRLLCPNALFFRENRICEDCLGKFLPWPGVLHACYRESRVASGTIALMLSLHRLLGTWTKKIDVYIALTEFARQKFIAGGIPAEKIKIKAHFVHPDPGIGEVGGNYALFVGRFSEGKGIHTLISAWKGLGKDLPLKIVGDGPLASEVASAAEQIPGVTWLGRKSEHEVYELMGQAYVVISASQAYETFGRIAMEAFAKGTPVITSNIGACAELVHHRRTGLHFDAGNSEDLARQVHWAIDNPKEIATMRRAARAEFEAKYTVEKSHQTLLNIYEMAMR